MTADFDKAITQAASQFLIGDLIIPGIRVLAPMDGFTDLPFRQIAKRFGASLVFTEFVNAMDILSGNPLARQKMVFDEAERPLAVQLFDDQPERLLAAARVVADTFHPDIIDINLGCTNRRVVSRGAGSALLNKPDKIGQMIRLLTKEIEIPITAKIRLGPDKLNKNFLEIGKIIEESGGKAITLHARTGDQGFTGKAQWELIGILSKSTSIPVIGNGDIQKTNQIRELIFSTGCEAVMIGRGAIGNPWIFSPNNRDKIPRTEIKMVILDHLDKSLNFYGAEKGLILFRKHVNRYVDHLEIQTETRKKLLTTDNHKNFVSLIRNL